MQEAERFVHVIRVITALGIFAIVSLAIFLFPFDNFVTVCILGVILPLLLVAYTVYTTIRRGMEMRRLAMEGVERSGTVTDKGLVRRGRQGKIRYAYHDSLGNKHYRTSLVAREFYDHLEVGSPVKVVYLPNQPSVSALLADVEKARRALGHKT
jgi:hypothetical protein